METASLLQPIFFCFEHKIDFFDLKAENMSYKKSRLLNALRRLKFYGDLDEVVPDTRLREIASGSYLVSTQSPLLPNGLDLLLLLFFFFSLGCDET